MTLGTLLQRWRQTRGKSQLDLALNAGVSPRHVSFIETGRSSPSREMVITLATALDVPFRERNALLLAAGYAPVYRETKLDAPELEPARRAIDLILQQQKPYPAVVMNRRWDILKTNEPADRLFAFLLRGAPKPAKKKTTPPNVLRLMFDPKAVRPHVKNWEAVAESLIQRVYREAVGGVINEETRALVKEVLAFPGVPKRWGSIDPTVTLPPLVPVIFAKGSFSASYFSAVTTLGTPQDITLQEIRVESFFPADDATAESHQHGGSK
jgi:transcriptional regulator with XRE-family HTH domain